MKLNIEGNDLDLKELLRRCKSVVKIKWNNNNDHKEVRTMNKNLYISSLMKTRVKNTLNENTSNKPNNNTDNTSNNNLNENCQNNKHLLHLIKNKTRKSFFS
jgi:hypothetical protein